VSDGCEEWRRWYWEGLVCRGLKGIQQSLSVLYCGNFHLQNLFECNCIRYNLLLFAVFFGLMFWVSYLINQNTANTFCLIRKYLLFRKTFKLDASKHAHSSAYQLMSQCCPPLPRYLHTLPVMILLSFVSICMNETGNISDWFLRNVAVLLIIECTAVI